MTKQYASPEQYETKLEKVMARLGVESYDYDWNRHECWVSFTYKGQPYRFTHSVKNAREHNIALQYGSDAFAQVVLSLEDLARMVERGIYDLSTWVAGMKYLPAAETVEPCFGALGFTKRPQSAEEVKARYKKLAKELHPDAGGDALDFAALTESYKRCLALVEEQ